MEIAVCSQRMTLQLGNMWLNSQDFMWTRETGMEGCFSVCGKQNVSNSREKQVQQAVMSQLLPTWYAFPAVRQASSFVQGKTTAPTYHTHHTVWWVKEDIYYSLQAVFGVCWWWSQVSACLNLILGLGCIMFTQERSPADLELPGSRCI